MVGALGAVLDISAGTDLTDAEMIKRVDSILDAIPDYAGMFYKYSLADSILQGKLR